MPKKFQGVSSKVEEARIRKNAAESSKKAALEKQAEDELWRDDDKRSQSKQQRKEGAVAKAEEKATRRAELKRLAEEEEVKTGSGKSSKAVDVPLKVTRAELERRALIAAKEKAAADIANRKTTPQDELLAENPNRLLQQQQAEAEAQGQEFVSATGLEDAVTALAGGKDAPQRPERRARAAFRAYEEQQMSILKAENPTLKKSQLQDRLWKQWQKAPENPFNQP